MTDHVLDRITFDPHADLALDAAHHPAALKPIPWPDEVRPVPQSMDRLPEDPLPLVKSVIVTWTAAEAQALWDVLDAPPATPYAHNYSDYHANLTERSPALNSKCLARIARVSDVLLVHSMLHLATDDDTLPLRRLLTQIIQETQCERIITTGTAGGVGANAALGDVIVADQVRFNCKKLLVSAPFAQSSYAPTIQTLSGSIIDRATVLVETNISQLEAVRGMVHATWEMQLGGIETTDFFAFDTSDDHFGLGAYDPCARAVEMDDATFGLVIADLQALGDHPPLWAAVRNVSDPQADMSKYATFEDAAADMGRIYRRYGYWTTVPSSIVAWLMAIQ
jgi:hypothetical protein